MMRRGQHGLSGMAAELTLHVQPGRRRKLLNWRQQEAACCPLLGKAVRRTI